MRVVLLVCKASVHMYLKRQIRSAQAELISLDVYGSIFFEQRSGANLHRTLLNKMGDVGRSFDLVTQRLSFEKKVSFFRVETSLISE